MPAPQRVLQAVIHVTRQIGAGGSLDAVFDTAAAELAELVPYDRCSIGLLQPDGENFKVIGLRGPYAKQLRSGVQPLAGSVGGWVIGEQRPLIYEITEEDRFREDSLRRELGIRQLAAVPILVDAEPIGVLAVSATEPDTYRDEQIWILQTIGDHLGLAIAATNLRRDAELRASRAQFLAETSELFASSLDLEQTLRRAVSRAGDVLGDLNAIFLRDDDTGELQGREVAHPDPEVEAIAREFGRAVPPSPHGRVFGPPLQGEPVLLKRIEPESLLPETREFVERIGIRSALAVPLITVGRIIGVLTSFCTGSAHDAEDDPRLLDEADLALAQDMATQIANAIENARLHAATRRALDESEALRRIGQELASSIELDRTLELVASFARLLLGADYAAVVSEGPSGEVAWRAMTGNQSDTHLSAGYVPGDGAVGRAMQTRQAIVVDRLDEAAETPAGEFAVHHAEDARVVLGVPLLAGNRAFGALVLGYRSGHAVTRVDQRLAASLAAQAAAVLENARLFTIAQEAIASRDEFLTVAAHELRTPLTTLRGRAQLLQRRLGTTLSQQDQDSIRIILRQLDRFNRMVNDLLDVSRMTAGRLLPDPEPTDLVALVQESAAEFDTPEYPILLETDGRELIGIWDPWRLEQVFANLLNNAIRYSPLGSPILLHLGRNHDEAIVTITDRGTGIAPTELERIFERFYRGEQQHRGGFGLGLAICRQIINDHGGRLWAASEGIGHGATFTIVLPLAGDT